MPRSPAPGPHSAGDFLLRELLAGHSWTPGQKSVPLSQAAAGAESQPPTAGVGEGNSDSQQPALPRAAPDRPPWPTVPGSVWVYGGRLSIGERTHTMATAVSTGTLISKPYIANVAGRSRWWHLFFAMSFASSARDIPSHAHFGEHLSN